MNNVVYAVLIILIIVFAPFCSIWAINTLFFSGPLVAYAIPYTFWTWLSIIIFGALLKGGKSSS
jgi:hypothetical protein